MSPYHPTEDYDITLKLLIFFLSIVMSNYRGCVISNVTSHVDVKGDT